MDSIAQTVVIEPPAEGPSTSPGEGGSAIVRVEGGGTPYSVTYDGDCFRLRPGGPTDDATDELCDLEPTDQLTAGVLGDGVVVGYASPLAVRVDTPGLDTPGAIATAIESSSVYAVDVGAEQQPAELVAVDATGRELARTEAG